MHIFEVIKEEAVYNILGHIRTCWNYTYPTGTALEEAVYRGLKPFYSDVRALGGPLTIVDVVKDTDAFDIKGAKQLGYVSKITKNSNLVENHFVEQTLSNNQIVKIKIPKDILAIVKRPNSDMERFNGDPMEILQKSLTQYETFARETTTKSNCQNLYSIVVLYEEDLEKGYRSIFFTLEKFSIPEIVSGKYIVKKDGTNSGYIGEDNTNSECYKLLGFNTGSVNSYKKYPCNRGILYTWTIDEDDKFIFDEQHINQIGSLRTI
jgi:hypothetical protein